MEIYGLIGDPITDSALHVMHKAAFDHLDMNAQYALFEPATDAGAKAVESADKLGLAGLNVTIPFKQQVVSAVQLEERAAQIGAVNTIVFDDGTPRGYNTETSSVIRAFQHHNVDLSGRAIVLGAGATGRAVAFALAEKGMRVEILNRTVERAESLATEINNAAVEREATGWPLDGGEPLIPDSEIIVNATPVGMEDDQSPIPLNTIHDKHAVLDTVYSPLETQLLRHAADNGALTIDGAWMLLYQGLTTFVHWSDQEPPVDIMHNALRDEMGGNATSIPEDHPRLVPGEIQESKQDDEIIEDVTTDVGEAVDDSSEHNDN